MIRGSSYSAVMHVGIILLILFGLPSLTFLLPIWDKEEVPLRVVVMSEKDADEISKKEAKAADASKTKDAAKAGERADDSPPDQKSEDRNKSPAQDAADKDRRDENQVESPTSVESANTPSGQAAAAKQDDDDKTLSKKLREKPKPPEQRKKGTISVVTDINPHAEGPDGKTTTRDPGDDDAAAIDRGREIEQNGAGTSAQTIQRKAKESSQTAKLPSTSAPQSQEPQQQAFQAPAVGEIPRPGSQVPPTSPAPTSPPQAARPTTTPSGPASPGVVPQSSQAAALPSIALPSQAAGSVAEQVSAVISEMAEKIPRLKSLRESLTQQDGGPKTNPAIEQSAKRMEERAEEGYAHAQFTLAEMYLTGEGMPKDEKKAVALLNRAAISGFLPAQLTLGMMAAEGRGMERNLAEAQTWLSVAADQGNRAAMEAVPKIEKLMAPRDTVEARKRSYQLHQILVIVHGGDLKKASKSELSERLRIAAALGDVESVHVLLAQGADADSPDLDGRTAVIEAAWRGYPRIVKSLIDNGANLSATDNTKKTAVMWAAINGHAGVIDNLVKAGSQVNEQDNEGMTALMRAAWNGHTKAVQALLANKANPNIRDAKGKTARDYAAQTNNAEIRSLLARVSSGG